MASSYSILNDYSNIPLYTPDFTLIQNGLAYKQGKLDTNRQKLQTARDQFGALDVVKGEDQEYLEGRLQQVTEMTNKYAGMDLSNDSLTNSLIGNMGQILDDNVKSAVIGTKILRNEQAEWADKRKNKPELYSDGNYAFAMQRANAWMTDGQTGTSYNGGGNFIEYRDVSKKLTDNIPKLQDALKAKWVSTGASEGYFRSINTNEKIDRGMLSQALDGLMDEKDRKQLQINAWSKYDNLPDEAIKKDWDDYYAPKIEEASGRIDALTALRDSAKTKGEKAQYSQAIESWQEAKTTLEGNTFEATVKTYGRSAAYTALDTHKFRDNYLDAYSYDTRVVDTKIDEVQKANVEFSRKIQDSDRDFALKVKELEIKEKEVNSKIKKEEGTETPWTGGMDRVVETDPDKAPLFEEHQKYVGEAVSGVEKALTSSENGFTKDQAKEAMRSPQFMLALKKGVAGSTISIGGKTVKLNPKLRNQLLTMQEELVNTSPAKVAAFTTLTEINRKTRGILAEALSNGDTETYNVPNFNIKHVKKGDKWTTVKMDFKEGQNRYAYLVRLEAKDKSKLSEGAKKDLELYSALHLLQDPTTSDGKRSLIKEQISYKMTQDLDAKGYKNVKLDVVNTSGKVMPNTYSKIPPTNDFWLSEISSTDVKGNVIGNITRGVSNYVNEAYTSILGTTEEQIFRKKTFSATGVDEILKAGFRNIDETLEIERQSKTPLVDKQDFTLSKQTNKDLYIKTANALGFESTDNKDITMYSETKDGVPTGNIVFERRIARDKDAKKWAWADRAVITEEQALERGIANINSSPIKYDASSRYPKSIQLGNGSYTTEGYDAGLEDANVEALNQSAKENGSRAIAETKRLLGEYENGTIEIELQPINGAYGYVATTEVDGVSKRLFENISPIFISKTLKETDVENLYENPKPTADWAFQQLLANYQLKLKSKE